jgi:hypothetical protein
MANFETTDAKATILYEQQSKVARTPHRARAEDRFIIQWESVALHNQPKSNGSFTFQVSLWRNGSIWFAYKNIPINVTDISDVHHPRKVGLSDAYLENANPATGGKLTDGGKLRMHTDTRIGKRIIHEYHRIEIDFSNVATNATIIINPKPSRAMCARCVHTLCAACINYTSCEACQADMQLKWNCTWCVPDSGTPFCSDSAAQNRMHSQFKNKCADVKVYSDHNKSCT